MGEHILEVTVTSSEYSSFIIEKIIQVVIVVDCTPEELVLVETSSSSFTPMYQILELPLFKIILLPSYEP